METERAISRQPQMRVDVLGCIRSTHVQRQHAFIPIFEAVVNSIHATQDRFGSEVSSKGEIDIIVHRVQQSDLALGDSAGRATIPEITSVAIVDNGVGFTDQNLHSFETAYSTEKLARGGKGVGRFSWLVVFNEARLESAFVLAPKKLTRRRFAFRPTSQGIEDFKESSEEGSQAQTRVMLERVRPEYAEALRKGTEAIADRLFEHCFHYFVMKKGPRIRLIDKMPDGDVEVLVNDRLKDVTSADPIELVVGKERLMVRHVQQNFRAGLRHECHLCAHDRVVTSFALSKVSDLGAEALVTSEGKHVAHHVFVSGPSLDAAVDTTRTRLDLPEEDPLFARAGVLDHKTLKEAIGAHVNEHLASELQKDRDENLALIRGHIQGSQPEYRPLLRHAPEQLARVKYTSDERQLDEMLYHVQQEWLRSARKRQSEVEQKILDDRANPDDYAEQLYQVIAEVNDVGQTNLVRYVAKRRVVLRLIRGMMSRRADGPALEEDFHRIVFPLRAQLDQLQYDDHNLWLVDETLSFYDYVASDISLSSNPVAPVQSRRRPDVLAFKTGEPYQHVAIVEFKRPDRDDENPVKQLVDYAIQLRDGGGKDVDGRSMPGISKGVRIDAYAIVSLTPRMVQLLRTGPANMAPADGEDRWFGGMPAENLHIEVLDYRAFVRRAEQRNHPFFVKLGLSK